MRNDDDDDIEVDCDWSGLKTVSSFDNGDNNDDNISSSIGGAVAMGLPGTAKELRHFSPSSLLVESLIEQLCKMVEKDPSDQKALYLSVCDKLHRLKVIDTSYRTDEWDILRNNYRTALYNLLSVAKTNHQLAKINRQGAAGVDSNTICHKVSSLKFHLELPPPESILEWSRYANEFVELEFIARGGFGQVYKARHKLDDTVYAIKKIRLRYQNANRFLSSLKEVKMLACLNHPNIVAYKAAWLEPFDNRSANCNRVTALIVDDDNSESAGETEESSCNVLFEKPKSPVDQSKDGCVLTSTDSSRDSPVSGGCAALCKFSDNFNKKKPLHFNCIKEDGATLFVQMQLCEENMREWLDRRNSSMAAPLGGVAPLDVNIEQCLSVFIEILKGIEYIHEKGIVHHDIKPSNIFVSKDLRQVQVGDFGLACCLLTHSTNTVSLLQQPSQAQHKGCIGTKLYAAPEQINGVCCPKSDIYSVGIILLELIQPFQTEMERSKVISLVKLGQMPAELTAKRSGLGRLICKTVSLSVNKRPTAGQLLSAIYDYKHNESSTNDTIIYEKELEIFRLKEEIAIKNEEILDLKRQLAKFQDKYNDEKCD